jgi:hypothetical protein
MTTTINTPTSSDIIDTLATKEGIASALPYAYAFGLAWASLTEQQQVKMMKMIEEMPDLEK